MNKVDKWEAEHVNWSGIIHVSLGLGIAWLLCLIWQGYSLISLVLGIVFLVAGIAGLAYPLLAKQ
ncbi:MAG TPA: hypothetical protein VMW37_01440 [Dehalococcoidales bacterium]|nr:hypothetical protein [Dehalococcoidales bacterium]